MSAIGGLVALTDRLEQRRGLLGLVKLANVGVALVWGFVVTFVFVRLLPIEEFRTFLLLIAFANFTVSAELGLSAIAYSRLRRDRIAGEGMFRGEEIVALGWVMGAIILIGAALIAGAIALGAIPTRHPLLFIAFYGVSAINLLAVLSRRALAALDHNLWSELLDFLRRFTGIALLLASLIGLPILHSVLIQLALSLGLLLLGFATIHRALNLVLRRWLSVGAGLGHIRTHYLADFGRTGALTLFDVAAYNAPYFTIAAATQDHRPLLLFDFVFKISRGLSAILRALTETVLPGLTRRYFSGDMAGFRAGLEKYLALAFAVTIAVGLGLLIGGPLLAKAIFDGKIAVNGGELWLIILLLAGLAIISVSVGVHNGLGRFGALVGPSFLFFLGSMASVPLAAMLAGPAGWSFSATFLALYASVHIALALVHGGKLARLGKARTA